LAAKGCILGLWELITWFRSGNPSKAIGPNMPIRDLFFHIRSDVLEDNHWVAVGNNILDRLASNELRAWGRRDLVNVDKLPRSPKPSWHIPLSPIRTEFWADAVFTDDFFADDHESYVHAIAKSGEGKREAYRDAQFNRAEASKIWPRSTRRKQNKLIENLTIFGGAVAIGILVFVSSHILDRDGSGIPPSKLAEAYWQPLNTKQKKALTEELLKVNRGKMVIGCNYAECRPLAREFYELFRRLGWDVPPPVGQNIDAFVEGITISPETKEAKQIATAIRLTTDNEVSVVAGDPNDPAPPIRLNVGTKPIVQ
jgi:hypothetical protein